jgi:DNA-binding NtrC family response regulator
MTTPLARILIADDEPLFLKTTGELLTKAGYECCCVADAPAALEVLARERVDLILSDLNMPGNLRLELIHEGRSKWPEVPLIVITGVPSLPTAIESLRLGIADYLLKPVSYRDLLSAIRRTLVPPDQRPLAPLSETVAELPPAGPLRPESVPRFPGIVGNCPQLREIVEVIERVAQIDTNILITGESGTGKEIVARTIHQHSRRAGQRFQVIDCTTIPENLFESVLFGHAQGAFTGAVRSEPGLLRQAEGGTAFFDEIGELPVVLQAKLLRVVQDQTFTPVGKHEAVRLDVRFICATNRDLEFEVNAGRFRRDLFYRLAVLHLELPPLRDRGEDIQLLADHFLALLHATNPQVTALADDVRACFGRYPWPGNLRELRNVIERALALARSTQIERADLPSALQKAVRPAAAAVEACASHGQALDVAEREYLLSLLQRHRGNVSRAARQAGLSRQGLHRLLNKHGIAAGDFRRSAAFEE